MMNVPSSSVLAPLRQAPLLGNVTAVGRRDRLGKRFRGHPVDPHGFLTLCVAKMPFILAFRMNRPFSRPLSPSVVTVFPIDPDDGWSLTMVASARLAHRKSSKFKLSVTPEFS